MCSSRAIDRSTLPNSRQGSRRNEKPSKHLRRSLGREENRQPKAIEGKGAARCAFGGKHTRTGPVWRVSDPFVMEALRLMNSVEKTLSKLVERGDPLA